jgi:hypothetical protein
MCKKTNSSTDGTSFQDVTFKASVNQLINVFGEPTIQDNTGEDKTNFEWDMETDEGNVFTTYDWKEYRELDLNEQIEWHIGSRSREISGEAQYEVLRELGNYVD